MLPRHSKRTRSTLVRKLDEVFSMYIRLRDSKAFGFQAFRCISCGQIKPFEQMDCGHFVGRTHLATRWNEDNCNGECRACNRMSADHLIYYQRNLERKIGAEKVDLLLAMGKQTKKWSEWELDQLIKYYTEQVKTLKK